MKLLLSFTTYFFVTFALDLSAFLFCFVLGFLGRAMQLEG